MRENSNYWVDIYDPSSVLTDANELLFAYTFLGELAYAQYKFPSRMDSDQVTRIAEMVATKYERWNKVSGNPELGPLQGFGG